MEIIANNLNKFDEDITDFKGVFEEMKSNYEMLVTHMNDLNRMWEGEAHNQFLETFSVDSAKVMDMINLLEEISHDLRYAHNEYSNCEVKVATIIDSINV